LSWVEVCDAWIDELMLQVPALQEAIPHRYAPWSTEALFAAPGERHLAVWPEGEAETATPFTTSPADLMEQSYAVLVWEDASTETQRRFDDESANADWLKIHEAIRARFHRMDNVRLGDANIMDTRYVGASFDLIGGRRVLAIRFRVRLPITYS
jgi:hypothetical protein